MLSMRSRCKSTDPSSILTRRYDSLLSFKLSDTGPNSSDRRRQPGSLVRSQATGWSGGRVSPRNKTSNLCILYRWYKNPHPKPLT